MVGLEATLQFISRHMPGRGAPQVPHPPEGASKDSELPACTAKAENNFSTRELLHFSQFIERVPTRRSFRIWLRIPNSGIRRLASFTPVRSKALNNAPNSGASRISPSAASLAQSRNCRIVHCLRNIRERIQDLAALLLAAFRRATSSFGFLFCFYKLRLRNRNVVVEFVRS